MGILQDMKAWVENAERAGDDNYGAAAELMREAIEEMTYKHCPRCAVGKMVQGRCARCGYQVSQ